MSNILHREWNEEWGDPANGKPVNLHRIDVTLDFNTGFLFDRIGAGGKKRRCILITIRADQIGTDVSINEPYVPIEVSIQEKTAMEYLQAIFAHTQEHGFDGAAPEQCIHGLHITAKMPHRHTGAMEDIHAMAFLPEPITWKDLILFAPASLIIPPPAMNLYLVADEDYIVAHTVGEAADIWRKAVSLSAEAEREQYPDGVTAEHLDPTCFLRWDAENTGQLADVLVSTLIAGQPVPAMIGGRR